MFVSHVLKNPSLRNLANTHEIRQKDEYENESWRFYKIIIPSIICSYGTPKSHKNLVFVYLRKDIELCSDIIMFYCTCSDSRPVIWYNQISDTACVMRLGLTVCWILLRRASAKHYYQIWSVVSWMFLTLRNHNVLCIFNQDSHIWIICIEIQNSCPDN